MSTPYVKGVSLRLLFARIIHNEIRNLQNPQVRHSGTAMDGVAFVKDVGVPTVKGLLVTFRMSIVEKGIGDAIAEDFLP